MTVSPVYSKTVSFQLPETGYLNHLFLLCFFCVSINKFAFLLVSGSELIGRADLCGWKVHQGKWCGAKGFENSFAFWLWWWKGLTMTRHVLFYLLFLEFVGMFSNGITCSRFRWIWLWSRLEGKESLTYWRLCRTWPCHVIVQLYSL